MRSTSTLIVPVVAGLALLLGGCSGLPGASPQRDATTGEVTQAQPNADAFQMRVGDCINSSELMGEETATVPLVPCADPHEDEVYYAFDLADGEFPGGDAIDAAAEESCSPQFDAFIGTSYAESVLDWYSFYPTVGSWDEGDREVLCLAYDPAGTVTGTLAGVAR